MEQRMHPFNKYLTHAAVLAAAISAPSAMADSLFSYNYAQLDYVDMDNSYDGLSISGSYEIYPQVAIIGSILDTSDSGNGYSRLAVGAAHHGKLEQLQNSEVNLHAELEFGDIEAGKRSDDEIGLRAGATLRLEIQPNLEAFGDVSYSTLFNNDLQVTPGVLLYISPIVAAHVSYQISDNDTLMFGVRLLLK